MSQKVKELAIQQLKEALRLIETGAVVATRVNCGFYEGDLTDLHISLMEADEEAK